MKKTDAYSNNASPDEADDFVHNEDHDDDADDHSGLRKKRTSTLTFYGRFFWQWFRKSSCVLITDSLSQHHDAL